jgi:hypothetical protein
MMRKLLGRILEIPILMSKFCLMMKSQPISEVLTDPVQDLRGVVDNLERKIVKVLLRFNKKRTPEDHKNRQVGRELYNCHPRSHSRKLIKIRMKKIFSRIFKLKPNPYINLAKFN